MYEYIKPANEPDIVRTKYALDFMVKLFKDKSEIPDDSVFIVPQSLTSIDGLLNIIEDYPGFVNKVFDGYNVADARQEFNVPNSYNTPMLFSLPKIRKSFSHELVEYIGTASDLNYKVLTFVCPTDDVVLVSNNKIEYSGTSDMNEIYSGHMPIACSISMDGDALTDVIVTDVVLTTIHETSDRNKTTYKITLHGEFEAIANKKVNINILTIRQPVNQSESTGNYTEVDLSGGTLGEFNTKIQPVHNYKFEIENADGGPSVDGVDLS